MVVDTSVILAILLHETDREALLESLLAAPQLTISAVSVVEIGIVSLRRGGERLLAEADDLLRAIGIGIIPVDAAQADLAIAAYARFGRGRHPAGLNFGDCFAYALARARGERLLFKGADFAATDLAAAGA